MRFKELLFNVECDKVVEILNKKYNQKEGVYEAYKQVIEELKSLKVKPCEKQKTLVVAKIKDVFDPGKFIFEVFGVYEGDEERYSLVLVPWEEWCDFEVLAKSIEMYGAAAVVATILYEMTFYGYSAKEQSEKVAEEIKILTERQEEVKSGKVELISHEEVMEGLGIVDDRSPEEKEQEEKKIRNIHAENQEVYKTLLGREKPY